MAFHTFAGFKERFRASYLNLVAFISLLGLKMAAKTIEYKGLTIECCEGVYEPSDDTFLVLENVSCGKKTLEIGAGTGIISIYCARTGSEVTAADISEKAIDCARRNAATNAVSIELVKSFLFAEVKGKFDTIIFNPPYLPTEDNIEGSEQWDGGADGFRITRPFLESADSYLETDGEIFLILSDLTDIEHLIVEFQKYRFEEIASVSFDFERIILYRLKRTEAH